MTAEEGPSRGSEPVLQEARGAGLWLTLNRPERLNGLGPEILDGLTDGLDRAERDPCVRAVVLAATGRAFCAGADLGHAAAVRAQEGHALRVLDELETLCDAHANYGLIPGAGGTVRLPRLIGPQRAKELVLTGNLLTATEAFALGFGNRVVPDQDVHDAAQSLVDGFASKSPMGLARAKRLIDTSTNAGLEAALRAERDEVAAHERSHDAAEGIAAFREKREPKFVGR